MGYEKSIKNAEQIFVAILVIGLIGILFLIIFGNLSGNLGYSDTSTTFTNESGYSINDTTYTLTGKSTAGFQSLAVTTVHNVSNSVVIGTGNYTVGSTAGTIVGTVGRTADYLEVNITYVVTHDGQAEQNSNAVIGNLTGGATQFFSFSNVWFILVAITVLIGIVIGVISLVRRTGGSKVGLSN